jgi:tRNA modification GTPase
MRAFLAGKFDLTRAEAVHGVIEAGSRDELRQALGQLAGGMTRPLHQLRDELLDLLAEVEAGLDFTEEGIRFIDQTDLLNRLAKGMAQVTLLQKQIVERAAGDRAFRVALVGKPNVGKTSLFNALAAAHALVSPEPGTTRDYLVRQLRVDETTIELIDTAGWQASAGALETQAQTLGRSAAEDADLVVLCLQANQPIDDRELTLLAECGTATLGVATKCDLSTAPANLFGTSVVSGVGIHDLRATLADLARRHFRPGMTSSLSRCRQHVGALLGHLRQAHAAVLYEDPQEVLALELRSALDQLGEMVGAVYTDDLLDRIFSRFCIGK